MNKLILVSLVCLLNVVAPGADYEIDPDHSSIDFKIRHLTSKVPGNFREFSGTFSYDDKKPESIKLSATIKAESIDTRNKKRDEHLKSADFFNVQKYPTITYVGKSAKKTGKDKGEIEGDLTMLGKTLPVKLNVESTGETLDPWGNTKAGLTVTGKLNRKDFGMVWNKALDQGGVILGDEVEFTILVEANKKKDAAATPTSAKTPTPTKTPGKK